MKRNERRILFSESNVVSCLDWFFVCEIEDRFLGYEKVKMSNWLVLYIKIENICCYYMIFDK